MSEWNYQIYSLQKVQNTVIILEEVVDTVHEMERQQVKAIKDRKLVQELQEQALKVVRCHYTEEFQREALQIVIPR